MRRYREGIFACGLLLTLSFASSAGSIDEKKTKSDSVRKLLWREPKIGERDLFFGAGGRGRAPGGSTYVFVKENKTGVTPKFVVRDKHGVKWMVKLGEEAKPETAATRLVWAAGYSTDADYLMPKLRVRNMPKLHRGGEFVSPDGTVRDARWERMDGVQIGEWHWLDNPFSDTRELNGLRVMMALVNNVDMKDSQNAIYRRGGVNEYVVSDMGATFGPTGAKWPGSSKKGDLALYSRSDFIQKVTNEDVNFATPSWPMMMGKIPAPPLPYSVLTAPVKLFGRPAVPDPSAERWIGKGIPRAHVRWIAAILGGLSPQQIRDAFRAAHYSPEEVEGFARVVEKRIAELKGL